ncbi:MAG: hypothetical protein ACE5FL_01160 [Myxococcota bacterium]
MRRRIGLVAMALLVVAIPRVGIAEEAEVVQAIRRCLDLLHSPEFELARGCFGPETLTGENADLLSRTHEALQLGSSLEYVLMPPRFRASTETTSAVGRIFHVRGDSEALLLVVLGQEVDSRPVILNITWEEVPLDLADRYPLTLVGMPVFYYLVVLYAVLMPCFMIYTAFLCLRRQPKFLWGWVAFVLLGFGNMSLVWRPGPFNPDFIAFAPISLQILGLGLYRYQEFNPWVLSVSFPLGAVIFLWWTRNWEAEDPGAASAREESS